MPPQAGGGAPGRRSSRRCDGGIAGNDASQLAIGVDDNLSRRTAWYATYSTISNDRNAASKVLGASPALSAGNTSQGVQIGVRHSF